MRSRNTFAVFRGGVVFSVVATLAFSCAHSPQEELSLAKASLESIEQSDASQYVSEETHAVRNALYLAETQIRLNQYVVAVKAIRQAQQQLDSAVVHYRARKAQAALRCAALLQFASEAVDSLELLAEKLPRQTYVDQNRASHVHRRIGALKGQMFRLRQAAQSQEYLSILREAPVLREQIYQTLKLLQPVPDRQYTVRTVSLPPARAEGARKESGY